mgnify:FL=1
MNKEEFFSTYNISEQDLIDASIFWEELLKIEEEYKKIEHDLHDIGKDFIDEYLYEIEQAGIHSYRYRTKAPDHLMEKIIRKRK